MTKERRAVAVLGAIALVTAGVTTLAPPKAEVVILTHDSSDPAPRRFETAVSVGIMVFRFLVTWTAQRAR